MAQPGPSMPQAWLDLRGTPAPGAPQPVCEATVFSVTSSCMSANGSSPRSFGVSMTPLALATAPAAPCFAVRSLSGSQGWCHLLLRPAPHSLCCLTGEAGSVVREHNACLLLPAPLSPQPRAGMAGLVTSRAERTFQFPLCFCTRVSTCQLLSVGPAFVFGADNKGFRRKHHQG